MPAERLQAVLDGLLLASQRRATADEAPALDESGDLPLIPGRTLGKNLAQKIQGDLLGRRGAVAAAVNAKCLQCHEVRSAASGEETLLPELLAANIPNPWLVHARFDHRAHRQADCRLCHADAFTFEKRDEPRFVNAASGALAARDNEEVMIAGIEVCATCHAPKRGDVGGARQDCAECHAYHGREAPLGRSARQEPRESAFPGGSLGTRVRLAAFTESLKPLGSASCSSANCHGSTESDAPAWKTAFTAWAALDPHARAYDVLFTQRSLEITRRLVGEAEALSEAAHQQVLRERCVDCHGPGSPGVVGSNLGVECEACHGAAEGWLHTHDRRGFRRDAAGFVDTKDLSVRARACLGCHSRYQATSDEGNAKQVVNHELIAAGHPRLDFELDSYLNSLPAHWDRQAEVARQGPAFHFQTWLTGQAEEEARRVTSSKILSPDFAELDCFACHHALAGDGRREHTPLASLKPRDWPPTGMLSIENSADLRERAALVGRFLRTAGEEGRWEAAVSGLTSGQAFARDLRARYGAVLREPLDRLRRYLAIESFPAELRRGRSPTIYDSPSDFHPGEVQPRIDAVLRALKQLEESDGQR
jgi:hypothetical protein